MKQAHKALAAGLVTAASMGMAGVLQAQVFTEAGDAGQTLATAAVTDLTTTPATINGTIGTATDADLYEIYLASPATFSATVTSTAGIDTALFLFDASGNPLVANDDSSNTSFNPTLPAGSTFTASLAAGNYYLGISLSGNEPVNSADQLLFTTDQPTTAVRGAASGLNPTTEADFNGGTFVDETGPYSIAVSVPEPSTYALLVSGVAAAAVTLVHRRRRAA